MKTQDLGRQILNALLIPIGIVIAMWPNSGPSSIGAISRETQPLFGAAGWAFTIWGLIFLGQLAYAIYQALPSQRQNPLLRRLGSHTLINAIGGAVWTLAFVEREFLVAWLVMLGLLANLIAIEIVMRDDARRGKELWLVRLPFAINLGWISVATILNTSQFLYYVVGWDGAPLSWRFWGAVVMVVALALAAMMLIVRKNRAFALVIAWAELAIAVEVAPRAAGLQALGIVAATGILLLVGTTFVMWKKTSAAVMTAS